MKIEEQVSDIVKEHGPALEPIKIAMEMIGCSSVIFWGISGEGYPYEIEFTHEEKKYKIGPFQFEMK
jgi:hypothetical protein